MSLNAIDSSAPSGEPQRTEHRPVAAEADQGVGLLRQLRLAHGLDALWHALGLAGVHNHLLAVRPRPAHEPLGDRRRVVARMQDEPESATRLKRLHGRNPRITAQALCAHTPVCRFARCELPGR
jgi:hypothetical protein